MKINRRQFLKLSSLTSAGMWAGLPSFTQFFDFIPPIEQNFIPIIGILPNPNSIKENGVHLRWVLPPSKGIPDSLTIFRKEHDEKENNIFVRPADTDKKTLPEKISGITFGGPLNTFSLAETDHGECYEVKSINPNNILRITFSLGVDFCNIQLGVINPLVAKSYHQDGTLSQSVEINSPSEYRSISFQSANGRTIKYVEIPINFKFLYFIEFNGNQFQCDNPDWEEIGFIDNENDINNQALFKRINPETKNFYLSNDSEREKYETTAKKYAGLMSAIRNPSEQYFLLNGFSSINDIPPDKLILKPKDGSQAKINAWNLLMFGSLDPNNARMLGLYFVDRSVESEDEIYDYKVEANYLIKGKKIRICGVVQNVGGKYSYVPILNNPLTAIQTDKTWWEFDKDFKEIHFGRVRLSWPIPEHNPNNESWKRFVEPVVYSLQADSQKSRLITPQPDESSLYFFDQRVIIKKEEINYTLTGVDIFGQTGNSLKQKIKLIDKDIPPAPVKLQFNSSVNQILLQYEYGGYQYLTDPGISKFTVFQKLESIYSNNKKIKYSSFEESGNTENGFRIIKVNLSENIGSTSFENIHFIESFDGSKLPAARRKKFKISGTSGNSVTFISSHFYTPEAKGTVLLESDIRDKNNGWLNIGSVNFNPDLSSRLNNYIHFIKNSDDPDHFSGDSLNDNSCLHAVVLSSNLKRRSENKNLFETNPSPPEQDEYTEIFIDRALIESDILTGGKISIGNINHDIASQSAGNAGTNEQSLQTRLIINTHLNVDSGTPVLISLPKINSDDNEKYIHNFMIFRIQPGNNLKSKSGGEILLRGIKNYKINEKIITETIPVVAQLFSDFYFINNRNELEVLVKIAKKINSLPAAQNLTDEISSMILYFEPYIKNITNNIEQISLANYEAFKSVQFAVETIDTEGNKSPLSLFGQFIKTRSIEEKPQTPERPFPCGNPAAAEGFLKIPDSGGRSAFCLQWNDIKDSSGNSLQYRYEVSRTLDKTIIAVHKDLWLKGLVDSILPVNERITNNNNSLPVSNSIVLADSGLIDAAAGYGFADNINPEIFIGGRLTQGTGNNRKYFEVVKCFRENSNLRLLLRQMVKTALANNFTDHSLLPSGNSNVTVNPSSPISNSNFILEAMPDYKQISDDNNRLIELANLSPTSEFPNIPDGLGAFSLVTGQPLRNTNQFLDDVPGLGSGRFFYKVRSVDASENRSRWSGCSIAVYQVDIRPVEQPKIIKAIKTNNSILIDWIKQSTDYKYLVFKSLNDEIIPSPDNQVVRELTSEDCPPIRFLDGAIDVKYVSELSDNLIKNNLELISIKKMESEGIIDQTFNYFVTNETFIENRTIKNINIGLNENDEIKIIISINDMFLISEDSLNRPIRVMGGTIKVKTNINIVEIIGIYKLSEFDPSRYPLFDQTVPNFVQGTSFTSMMDNLDKIYLINEVNNNLENQTIILLIRAKKYFELSKTLDTGTPLKFLNGNIPLYEKNNEFIIVGVYKYSEFDSNAYPFVNQSAFNYYTNTSIFDKNSLLIEQLAPGLTQGDKLAIIISYSTGIASVGYNRFIENPITNEPIRFFNNSINMNWLANVEKIVSIINTSEELNNSNPFNYALTRKTVFDLNNKIILYPNPHLTNYQSVVLEFQNSFGSRIVFERLSSLIEYKEEINQEYTRINYSITSFKNLHIENISNIKIKSVPSFVKFIN